MPVEVSCAKRLMNETEMAEMAEYGRLCHEESRSLHNVSGTKDVENQSLERKKVVNVWQKFGRLKQQPSLGAY